MRNKRLDILRAIAVALVLGRHGAAPETWTYIGWVGVDLFFVLSGFLISGLLYAEYKNTGGIRWGRFFVRRGFKIYPSFYVMLFATLCWQIIGHQAIHWKSYLPEVLFFQSYDPDRVWPHTWSLAVEEHFYIFLPLLLLVILGLQRKTHASNPFKAIPVLCLVLGAFCLFQRYRYAYGLTPVEGWWQAILYPTHLRIDSLFFGVFLGYLHHFQASTLRQVMKTRWARIGLLLVSGLLVSTCFVFAVDSRFMLSFGLTALYLGFGGILILTLYSAPVTPKGHFVWNGWLRIGDVVAYIGMYSYSIYLWHLMVIQHYQGFLRVFGVRLGETSLFWCYLALSLTAGIILSKLIEYPALHIRDRLFPVPGRQDTRSSAKPSLQLVVADVGFATNAEHTQEE